MKSVLEQIADEIQSGTFELRLPTDAQRLINALPIPVLSIQSVIAMDGALVALATVIGTKRVLVWNTPGKGSGYSVVGPAQIEAMHIPLDKFVLPILEDRK